MSKTEQYLKEAFAGESEANRKYLAFAEKADNEGYPQAARLFRASGRSGNSSRAQSPESAEQHKKHKRKSSGSSLRRNA